MGCGGSKEDVAAGNTVTRRLLRKASSVITSRNSSTDAATTTKEVDAASDVATITPVEGAPVMAPEEAEVIAAQDQTSSSDEYFSSGKDMEEGLEAVAAGSDEADTSAQVVAAALEPEPAEGGGVAVDSAELKEEEKFEAEKEIEEMMSTKDDEGESIGQHSVDFKETISVIEGAGGEVIILENNDTVNDTVSELGQHSVDFKETISVIEEAGGEVIILENKDTVPEVGQHSADFKETISVIEDAEGEVVILENKDNTISEAPAEIVEELSLN